MLLFEVIRGPGSKISPRWSSGCLLGCLLSVLGGRFRTFRCTLGVSLALFGCLWVLLRVFWGLVEVLLSAFGAPLGILGIPWAFLGPLWGPFRFLTLRVSISL